MTDILRPSSRLWFPRSAFLMCSNVAIESEVDVVFPVLALNLMFSVSQLNYHRAVGLGDV